MNEKMESKKELSKIQQYAIKAANKNLVMADKELQSIVDEVGREVGIDLSDSKEQWKVSRDMTSFERVKKPLEPNPEK